MQKTKNICHTGQRKKMSDQLDKRDNTIFNDESKNDNINYSSVELSHQSKLISGFNNNPVSENRFPLSWEFIS